MNVSIRDPLFLLLQKYAYYLLLFALPAALIYLLWRHINGRKNEAHKNKKILTSLIMLSIIIAILNVVIFYNLINLNSADHVHYDEENYNLAAMGFKDTGVISLRGEYLPKFNKIGYIQMIHKGPAYTLFLSLFYKKGQSYLTFRKRISALNYLLYLFNGILIFILFLGILSSKSAEERAFLSSIAQFTYYILPIMIINSKTLMPVMFTNFLCLIIANLLFLFFKDLYYEDNLFVEADVVFLTAMFSLIVLTKIEYLFILPLLLFIISSLIIKKKRVIKQYWLALSLSLFILLPLLILLKNYINDYGEPLKTSLGNAVSKFSLSNISSLKLKEFLQQYPLIFLILSLIGLFIFILCLRKQKECFGKIPFMIPLSLSFLYVIFIMSTTYLSCVYTFVDPRYYVSLTSLAIFFFILPIIFIFNLTKNKVRRRNLLVGGLTIIILLLLISESLSIIRIHKKVTGTGIFPPLELLEHCPKRFYYTMEDPDLGQVNDLNSINAFDYTYIDKILAANKSLFLLSFSNDNFFNISNISAHYKTHELSNKEIREIIINENLSRIKVYQILEKK